MTDTTWPIIDSRSAWLAIRQRWPASVSRKLIVNHVKGGFASNVVEILSAMRDLDPIPVCLQHVVPNEPLPREQVEQLRSLGFKAVGNDGTSYCFNISNYKATPEWLSPRHWANPELWDKYRW